MSVHTRSQKLAQAAFRSHCKQERRQAGRGIRQLCQEVPALIHTCGLAQAVAFALAKKEKDYVEDLAAVLKAARPSREITDRIL